MSDKKKNYIGPTISSPKKNGSIPEGPTAEFSNKLSRGMGAAKNLFGGEPPKVEGTPVKSPLPIGPPQPLPPSSKSQQQLTPKAQVEVKTSDGKTLTQQELMGRSHIASYQALLANDRLEKPRIKAWQSDESSDSAQP